MKVTVEQFKNTLTGLVGKKLNINEQSFESWYNRKMMLEDTTVQTAPEEAIFEGFSIERGDKFVLNFRASYEVLTVYREPETHYVYFDEYTKEGFTVELEAGEDMPFDCDFVL